MTDAQYWSIANSLPRRTLNGIIIVDWRSAIPGCDPNIREACEFVLGFNPLSSCWVDPGAQYVNPPPAGTNWGVTLCNAPPPTGGGGSSGGGTTGGGATQCPAGTSLVNGQCTTIPPAPLPALNMNMVLIGLGVLALLMFMRK